MAYQTNPYQTAVGNPAQAFKGAGDSFAKRYDELKQEAMRNKSLNAMGNLAKLIQGGGEQSAIDSMMNRNIAGGANADMINKLRGLNPDADKAAAYATLLKNNKLIADTRGVNASTGRTNQLTRQGTAAYKNARALETAKILGLNKEDGKVIPAVQGASGNPTFNPLSLTPVQFNTPRVSEPKKVIAPTPYDSMTPDALRTLQTMLLANNAHNNTMAKETAKGSLDFQGNRTKNLLAQLQMEAKNTINPIERQRIANEMVNVGTAGNVDATTYMPTPVTRTEQQEAEKINLRDNVVTRLKEKDYGDGYNQKVMNRFAKGDLPDAEEIEDMYNGDWRPDRLTPVQRGEVMDAIKAKDVDTSTFLELNSDGQDLLGEVMAEAVTAKELPAIKKGYESTMKRVLEKNGFVWDAGLALGSNIMPSDNMKKALRAEQDLELLKSDMSTENPVLREARIKELKKIIGSQKITTRQREFAKYLMDK